MANYRRKSQVKLGPNWETWPIEYKLRYLEQLRALDTSDTVFKRQYRDDPIAFAHDCIDWRDGDHLTPYQEEIIAAIRSKRRVAVRGPHGLGKTCIAAITL